MAINGKLLIGLWIYLLYLQPRKYKFMLTPQNIKQIIAGKSQEEQLETIVRILAQGRADSGHPVWKQQLTLTSSEYGALLAEKGKLLWRMDRRGEAMSAYEQGAQLDPDGPAALLLAHSRSIMDFFNPDLLNP